MTKAFSPALEATPLLFRVIPCILWLLGRSALRLTAESAKESVSVSCPVSYNQGANRGMAFSEQSAIQAQGLDYEDRIGGCHSCFHCGFPPCGTCGGSVRRACLWRADR